MNPGNTFSSKRNENRQFRYAYVKYYRFVSDHFLYWNASEFFVLPSKTAQARCGSKSKVKTRKERKPMEFITRFPSLLETCLQRLHTACVSRILGCRGLKKYQEEAKKCTLNENDSQANVPYRSTTTRTTFQVVPW